MVSISNDNEGRGVCVTTKKKTLQVAAGLSTAVLLTGVPVPLAGVWGNSLPKAYAAEQQAGGLTQEQAVQQVRQLLDIPADYKMERTSYLDESRNSPYDRPLWNLSWVKDREGYVSAAVDAVTGQLMQYSHYSEKRESDSSPAVSEEQALRTAEQFLERAVPKAEREKLSKPNEYPGLLHISLDPWGERVFSFTRMEGDTPFLGNGFQVIVGRNGEVVSFLRMWYQGELPDAKAAIGVDEAERLLAEKAAPSLVYTRANELTGRYQADRNRYRLVYRYGQTDPQFVDAATGTVLNALGEPAEEGGIKPLGSTDNSREADRLIGKEEAQKIAEELVKRLPGSYRSEGSRGGGSSSGPDGVETRHWRFEFTPLHVQGKNVEPVEISVSDRGELVEYRVGEPGYPDERGRKIEKAVSWKAAQESAVKLVKTLLSDRLGDIYLIDREPSRANVEEVLERGRNFAITFGWLKDGVPIEDREFRVTVNPETGEAEELLLFEEGPVRAEETAAKIDRKAAAKAERERKKLMLTYFLPELPRNGMPAGTSKPLLVYRYVGDQGVVDAVTGEWLSFADLRQKEIPQDIDGHAEKEALQFAIREGLLAVTDGKVEPDKAVTRGDMVQMLSRMVNRIGLPLRPPYFGDEDRKAYQFADVDVKHPLYGVIQKAIQYGLIPEEGTRFEPDRPATRGEAAEMAARLLGFGELLEKPGLFVSPYRDVEKRLVPAVALVHAYGLLPSASADAFQPDKTLTRAEAAKLMKALLEARDLK
ncbi:S-layer homology domain-containing protein [Brevibacillus sp. LEMMJ03]|nr:S-layer homology domain-containing protein [Brevibacillus sp. LEMMJ03]